MTNTIEQPALFSLEAAPEPAIAVEFCPACHSNWGAKIKDLARAHVTEEHRIEPDGRCAMMHRTGVTERFYTRAEIDMVRADGWRLPFPRPRGFAGIYQLKAHGTYEVQR